jgi:SWI/SNF-related matrix-associated actin-dependent regulator of chromatin subfamily A3
MPAGLTLLSVPPAAEEMGLGKTVEVLSLILANRPPASHGVGDKTPLGKIRSGATLVVCAVSLVGQWVDEAKSKLAADSGLRIHMYHGTNRIRDPMRLAKDFDLVVTTYATMASDFGGKKGNNGEGFPPLGDIEWVSACRC